MGLGKSEDNVDAEGAVMGGDGPMDVGRDYEHQAQGALHASEQGLAHGNPGGPLGNPDFGGEAMQLLSAHLGSMRNNGSMRDKMDEIRAQATPGHKRDGSEMGDGLPKGPGFTYANHLFRKMKKMRDEKQKQSGTDEVNIYTDQQEALKTAIGICGVYSDKNPGGMPIEIKSAKRIWFGKDEPDGFAEAEFRSLAEMGDRNIDPKRIRKFVNYDGSMTWEVLNEDKTVMSRFTMGEFAGTKVFTQGGYSKFAEVLKKVQAKAGGDGSDGFDAVRGRLAR